MWDDLPLFHIYIYISIHMHIHMHTTCMNMRTEIWIGMFYVEACSYPRTNVVNRWAHSYSPVRTDDLGVKTIMSVLPDYGNCKACDASMVQLDLHILEWLESMYLQIQHLKSTMFLRFYVENIFIFTCIHIYTYDRVHNSNFIFQSNPTFPTNSAKIPPLFLRLSPRSDVFSRKNFSSQKSLRIQHCPPHNWYDIYFLQKGLEPSRNTNQ